MKPIWITTAVITAFLVGVFLGSHYSPNAMRGKALKGTDPVSTDTILK